MQVIQSQTEGAQIVKVIRTVHTYGKGTPDDPYRLTAKYWTKEGRLIAEHDINDDPMNPLLR